MGLLGHWGTGALGQVGGLCIDNNNISWLCMSYLYPLGCTMIASANIDIQTQSVGVNRSGVGMLMRQHDI